MDYLKPIFGEGALTFDEFVKKLGENKEIKLANLADGKYVDKSIKHFFENSDILYASKNKKITANLLTRVGFYMPTDLLKSGYIGSITYENEKVKIKSE